MISSQTCLSRLTNGSSRGKDPQHLLFALFAPYQPPFRQPLVQDGGDGVAFDIDILTQLEREDFIEFSPPSRLWKSGKFGECSRVEQRPAFRQPVSSAPGFSCATI